MLKLYLLRDHQASNVTIGRIFNPEDNLHFQTLELPYNNNLPNISCIPEGLYTCKLDFYNRGGYKAFEVLNVPFRSEIKIHIGNWTKDVKGCIVIGRQRFPNNEDPMITQSRSAFNQFMGYMEDEEIEEFELEIIKL